MNNLSFSLISQHITKAGIDNWNKLHPDTPITDFETRKRTRYACQRVFISYDAAKKRIEFKTLNYLQRVIRYLFSWAGAYSSTVFSPTTFNQIKRVVANCLKNPTPLPSKPEQRSQPISPNQILQPSKPEQPTQPSKPVPTSAPAPEPIVPISEPQPKVNQEVQVALGEAEALFDKFVKKPGPVADEEKQELLKQINQIRTKLIDLKNAPLTSESEQSQCKKAIKDLERLAIVKNITLLWTDDIFYEYMKAAKEAVEGRGALFELDGKILAAGERLTAPTSDVIPVAQDELQKQLGQSVVLEQFPGLHQYSDPTCLCPYFALFFLSRAFAVSPNISAASFTDRKAFNLQFAWWRTMMARKYAQAFLNTRTGPIPDKVYCATHIPVENVKYLIENSRSLSPLQESSDVLIVNLFDLDRGSEASVRDKDDDPVFRMDKAVKGKGYRPLFLMVQSQDHVYFFHASKTEAGTKLVGVHSLGYKILDKFLQTDLTKLLQLIAKEWS